MNKNFFFLLCICTVIVCLPLTSFAYGIIDFEFDEAQDDMEINDQFRDEYGVTFGLDTNNDGQADAGAFPTLERVGEDGTDAFVNDPLGRADTARQGYEEQLGDFFLKTVGWEQHQGLMPSLLIMYDSGSAGMSGEIWDIDGNDMQGSEKWTIEALGQNGELLDIIESPEYQNFQDATSLNGAPFEWAFEREVVDIYSIRISFSGTKPWGTGVAFNNFAPYSPVPESSTVFLLGGGVLALVAVARKRQR